MKVQVQCQSHCEFLKRRRTTRELVAGRIFPSYPKGSPSYRFPKINLENLTALLSQFSSPQRFFSLFLRVFGQSFGQSFLIRNLCGPHFHQNWWEYSSNWWKFLEATIQFDEAMYSANCWKRLSNSKLSWAKSFTMSFSTCQILRNSKTGWENCRPNFFYPTIFLRVQTTLNPLVFKDFPFCTRLYCVRV